MTRRRVTLSAAQRSQLAAASATLRLADRAVFVDDVARALLALDREPTNDDVARAIADTIGVTPVTHAFLCDGVPDKHQTNQRTKQMNRKDHEIIGRDGVRKRVPPDYLLQDGERLRVSLRDAAIAARTATDASGLNAVQRAIRDAALLRDGVAFHDGVGNPSGNRPGFCLATDADIDRRRALVADAYEAAEAADENAWRGDPPWKGTLHKARPASHEEQGGVAGDVCVVRSARFPEHYGAAGHLRQDGGQLICHPDALAANDALTDDREAAYAEVEARARNAWRTPR